MTKNPWNKGKTKYTDERVMRISKKLSITNRGKTSPMKGRQHTEESKKKMSISHTGVKLSREHVEKSRLSRIGMKMSEQAKQRNREARLGVKHPLWRRQIESMAQKGKKLTEVHKQKIRLALSQVKRTEEWKKNISLYKKNMKFSEKHRKKLSEVWKEKYKNGFVHPSFGKKLNLTKEARAAISKRVKLTLASGKIKIPFKNTKIEEAMNNELMRRGFIEKVHYFRHFPIHDPDYRFVHQVDFIFPEAKLIVECDGIYWHKYEEVKKAHDYVGRDKIVNDFLKSKGYRVLRYWEHHIKKDVNDVGNRIVKKLVCINGG